MDKNRKNLIYGIVLLAVMGGLTVDKLFLAGAGTSPASAHAASVLLSSIDGSLVNLKLPVIETATSDQYNLLSDRMKDLFLMNNLQPSDMPDAFQPSKLWGAAIESKSATGSLAAAFLQSHQLNAVLDSGDVALVMIDGKPLRLGKKIDGFTLTAVGDRSAVLVAKGQTVKLTLKDTLKSN